ncbi:hypothetical protein ES332_A07G176100v1 [Gossypium tomentosum]|uniref:Uncharacterized protein n=1 Tax=Gossypium tomentosum TaxID=34277 RepID=A0A5D2PU67_GOSTO|nr:hypothetical protein ES332_A07G176100v1 [Gossypium tomentosum]
MGRTLRDQTKIKIDTKSNKNQIEIHKPKKTKKIKEKSYNIKKQMDSRSSTLKSLNRQSLKNSKTTKPLEPTIFSKPIGPIQGIHPSKTFPLLSSNLKNIFTDSTFKTCLLSIH